MFPSPPRAPAPGSATDYISPFTAPATPNLPKSAGSSPRKPSARRAPRSPLPPHRLAKLANALGVSTPLPASHRSTSNSLRRSNSAQPGDLHSNPNSRSATPLSVAGRPSPSRYLIHVVPPKQFPHESRSNPQAYASFRRGSLVPLHATLPAQLSAIAREYQLPTTHGLVLYLVGDAAMDDADNRLGKGPRISDEVWKWLSLKVADEQPILRGVGLGLSSGASSPAPSEQPSPLRKLSSSSQIEAFPRVNGAYPLTPSSSSPTFSASIPSIKHSQSSANSSPPERSGSSQSSNTSPSSATDTPPTSSLEFDSRLLPGLGSPSLIPVLAKVEFDIDRRIGTWYDAWCRSRREMQRRRATSVDAQGKLQLRITITDKKGMVSPAPTFTEQGEDEDDGYARLSNSPDEFNPDDELTARVSPARGDPLVDVFGTDGETWSDLQVARPLEKRKGDLALDGAALSDLPDPESDDPLIAGSDKDEVMALWNTRDQPMLNVPRPTTPQSLEQDASLRSTPQSLRKPIPPPLTLSPRANMQINVATPTPSPYTTTFGQGDDSHLAYLTEQDSIGGADDDRFREKRVGGIYDDIDLDLDLSTDFDPDESRASQLKMQEELDLLERNLAQLSPRVLETIELVPEDSSPNKIPMRSAPPGSTTFAGASQTLRVYSQRGQLKSTDRDSRRLVPTIQQLHPARPSMEMEERVSASPPTFRQPVLVGTPSPIADSFKGVRVDAANTSTDGSPLMGTRESLKAAWPAVPYSSIANRNDETPLSPITSSPKQSKRLTNSPPKVVLTGSPKTSPKQKRKNSLSISSLLTGSPRINSESAARTRQYEEEGGSLLQPSISRKTSEASDSPVMPISPDPFGRFPSSDSQGAAFFEEGSSKGVAVPPERKSSLAGQTHSNVEQPYERPPSKTPSSRFSADSVLEEAVAITKSSNRSTLVSMKSFRKLWRKTNKSSISGASALASPDPSMMPPRPPSSAASAYETEAESSRAPSPSVPFPQTTAPIPSGRTSQASMRGAYNGHGSFSQANPQNPPKPARRDSGLDPFYFDQDSKYPVRRSPSPQNVAPITVSRPPTPSAVSPTTPTATTPGTEKKRTSRKSILKWKSGNPNGPADEAQPRRSTDLSTTDSRRRRPSIMNVATNMMRGSVVSTIEQSPSVPELPAEYRLSRLSRASVSTARNTNGVEQPQITRTNSGHRKPEPSSSTDSSDLIHTPVSAIGISSIPNGNDILMSPRASEDIRSSFDDSEFEIVSPVVGKQAFEPSLSRPYTINHDG